MVSTPGVLHPHLSLLLSSPFLFLFYTFFSFPFLHFFSLLADFWCGDRRHTAPLRRGWFQTCSNKCILYVLSFHKCINIKYKTVNMYGVFLWLVRSSSRWNTIHSHRNYHHLPHVQLSVRVGEFCHPTRSPIINTIYWIEQRELESEPCCKLFCYTSKLDANPLHRNSLSLVFRWIRLTMVACLCLYTQMPSCIECLSDHPPLSTLANAAVASSDTCHCYSDGHNTFLMSWKRVITFFLFFLQAERGFIRFCSFSKAIYCVKPLVFLNNLVWVLSNFWPKWLMRFPGVLNFELSTDVWPEVSTTTL